jgi:hypothetical protein
MNNLPSIPCKIPILSFSPTPKSSCEELKKLGNKPITKFSSEQNAITDYYDSYGIDATMAQYHMSYNEVWGIVRPVREERRQIEVWELNNKSLLENCQKESQGVSYGTGPVNNPLVRNENPLVIESSINSLDSIINRREFLIPAGILIVLVVGGLLLKTGDKE